MTKPFGLILTALIALCGFSTVAASPDTVALPLSIDYPLLRSLTVAAAYPDAAESSVLVDEDDGCTRIAVSSPRYQSDGPLLLFETRVSVDAGTPMGDSCLMPIAWEGFLILLQKPAIDRQNWQLSFETVDSRLVDKNRQPAQAAGLIWNLIKSSVIEQLGGIRVNLAPPVSDLKAFLLPLFPQDQQTRTQHMLDGLRPGKVSVTKEALRVEILADIEPAYELESGAPPETLTPLELEDSVKTWELWDALMVEMITTLAGKPLSEEDRQVLLDAVLATRYRFISELSAQTLGRDFVRDQFVKVWKQISPVFKKRLGEVPSENIFGYLAFFTASDALTTLDQLGPALGIEISRNGLVRLIRMLNQKTDLAATPGAVNQRLRETLGFDPLPPPDGPAIPSEGLDVSPEGADGTDGQSGLSKTISSLLVSPAWAGQPTALPTLREIRKWLVPKKGIDAYIERVKKLLIKVADASMRKKMIQSDYREFYRDLTLSTAWQESCYRQFLVKKNKLTYLRSYNGSSVGIMQINERVWRGIYDLNHLRWNIVYNAQAGCEIVDLYFRKYALKHIHKLKPYGEGALAGLVYALYNSGPGELKKFLEREERGKYYQSDRLFREKYTWVTSNQWEKVDRCLVGG